jgi:hypothetical protein
MCLHPVGSAGHIVHFGASGARNVDDLFSCSGGPSAVSINNAIGYVVVNFYFCIQWDLQAA